MITQPLVEEALSGIASLVGVGGLEGHLRVDRSPYLHHGNLPSLFVIRNLACRTCAVAKGERAC
jgi:hypothetical protein